MLKAQLRSKISQLAPQWRDIEDILTGDYFGTLDYLPRQPFLPAFLRWVADLNLSVEPPAMQDVDWDGVEMLFWPMRYGEQENAEPDIVLVSNRWVIVIEVKLDSGLGHRQPWREYVVGKEIATERGLPPDSVYYLVVARTHLSVNRTFADNEEAEREELSARTLHLRWSQAASLIELWLRKGAGGKPASHHAARLLTDLLEAMRQRRALVFSGFSFAHQDDVTKWPPGLFCPPRFCGFLRDAACTQIEQADQVFLSRFAGFGPWVPCQPSSDDGISTYTTFTGFLEEAPATDTCVGRMLLAERFRGFVCDGPIVVGAEEAIFAPSGFSGFLHDAPGCRSAPSWVASG